MSDVSISSDGKKCSYISYKTVSYIIIAACTVVLLNKVLRVQRQVCDETHRNYILQLYIYHCNCVKHRMPAIRNISWWKTMKTCVQLYVNKRKWCSGILATTYELKNMKPIHITFNMIYHLRQYIIINHFNCMLTSNSLPVYIRLTHTQNWKEVECVFIHRYWFVSHHFDFTKCICDKNALECALIHSKRKKKKKWVWTIFWSND